MANQIAVFKIEYLLLVLSLKGIRISLSKEESTLSTPNISFYTAKELIVFPLERRYIKTHRIKTANHNKVNYHMEYLLLIKIGGNVSDKNMIGFSFRSDGLRKFSRPITGGSKARPMTVSQKI